MPLMLGNNGIGNCQPKAVATLLSGKIGIKNFEQVFRRDTKALTAEDDLHILPWRERHRGVCTNAEIVYPYVETSTVGHSLGGVEHHIVKDLMHLACIHCDRPEIVRKGKAAAHLGAV